MYYTQEIRRNRSLSESGSSFVCRGRANLIMGVLLASLCLRRLRCRLFGGCEKCVCTHTTPRRSRHQNKIWPSAHVHCQSSHTKCSLLRSIYPSQGPNHWLEIKAPRQFFPIADTTYHTTLQTNSRPHQTTQSLKQNFLLPFPRGFRT